MSRSQSLVAIHLVAIFFGTCGILGELIQADASVITWGRSLFAVISLAVFSRLAGGRRVDETPVLTRWRALLGSGAMLSVHWVTFFYSVKVGGIAVATLGFASFPAFITFVEWALLREHVSRAEWLRLAIVSAGLVLVTPSFSLADRGTEGLLWGLLSGATFGLLAVINRRSLSGLNAFRVAGAQNAVVLILLSGWVLPHLGEVSAASWLWILVLGIVCTGVAHWLFVSSLRQLPARTAGLVVALEPVYAIAFAWILFGQEPSLRMVAGGALMIGAIFSASLAIRNAP
jgi:drug/metabolite transporter (DMT)-like permease